MSGYIMAAIGDSSTREQPTSEARTERVMGCGGRDGRRDTYTTGIPPYNSTPHPRMRSHPRDKEKKSLPLYRFAIYYGR
jgi:hypothetical protein